MLLAIRQFATNTYNKHSTVFLANSILALLGRFIRIHLQEFLCMDKRNLLGQERLNLRICLTGQVFRPTDSGIDALHHILQICHGALFLSYHSLPVPLVNIQRMQVVQLLVSSDSIHIRIDTISWFYFVFCQRQTLPFCQ